ncbi:unnamed protein product [Rotaria socialis]|uniref:Uncharacterized protein n=1 Tax=Rotaria socialis TaxID=392032 RepID=A0A817TV40_9BILA|nr:unnamed protein product [Rotaria socialis]
MTATTDVTEGSRMLKLRCFTLPDCVHGNNPDFYTFDMNKPATRTALNLEYVKYRKINLNELREGDTLALLYKKHPCRYARSHQNVQELTDRVNKTETLYTKLKTDSNHSTFLMRVADLLHLLGTECILVKLKKEVKAKRVQQFNKWQDYTMFLSNNNEKQSLKDSCTLAIFNIVTQLTAGSDAQQRISIDDWNTLIGINRERRDIVHLRLSQDFLHKFSEELLTTYGNEQPVHRSAVDRLIKVILKNVPQNALESVEWGQND